MSFNTDEVRIEGLREFEILGKEAGEMPLAPLHLFEASLEDGCPLVRELAMWCVGRLRHNGMDAVPQMAKVLLGDDDTFGDVNEAMIHRMRIQAAKSLVLLARTEDPRPISEILCDAMLRTSPDGQMDMWTLLHKRDL